MKKIEISNENEVENSTIPKKKFIIPFFHENFIKTTKIHQILLLKYFFVSFLIILFILLIKLFIKIQNSICNIENLYNNLIVKSNNILNNNNILFIEKYKRTSIEWPLPEEIIFKPIMTLNEMKAFCYFMKPENIYFEFGSGGSTNIASYYKIKTFSVESDVRWHKKLKDKYINATYITIDLKAQDSGYPGNYTTIEDWKKYIQAYKEEYNADIILIDGRFRVACGLDIFNKIRNDTIVLIHDYSFRKEYHILENYYLKLEVWDSLVAFIKRKNISIIPPDIYNHYLNEAIL